MKHAEIEALLPSVFQQAAGPGTPISALLDAMEQLHAPTERSLAEMDALFDPIRTRDDFVPVLARWLNQESLLTEAEHTTNGRGPLHSLSTGHGHLRVLSSISSGQSQWSGTGRGLKGLLQAATGCRDIAIRENIDAQGLPRPFHLTVQVPASLAPHRELIERIIAREKPAYSTNDLIFSP